MKFRASFVAFVLLSSTSAAGQQLIVVQPGQTLSGISFQVFGTTERWREICDTNRTVIGQNCHLVRSGVTLQLPGSETPSTGADNAIVAGPIDLADAGWVIEGPTFDASTASVHSQTLLLRSAVYDPVAKQWLAGPENYEIAPSGYQQIAFSTGPETTTVRVYPLRGRDNSSWVYHTFSGLEPSTAYFLNWTVVRAKDQYSISDLTISRAGSQ